jgi:hypothetical protein
MSIEFKYDINDFVWFIRNAKVYGGLIKECSYFKYTTCGEEYEHKTYIVDSEYDHRIKLKEDELFLTKVSLLENFIKENNL